MCSLAGWQEESVGSLISRAVTLSAWLGGSVPDYLPYLAVPQLRRWMGGTEEKQTSPRQLPDGRSNLLCAASALTPLQLLPSARAAEVGFPGRLHISR